MRKVLLMTSLALLVGCASTHPQAASPAALDAPAGTSDPVTVEPAEKQERSFGGKLLMYLPNRVVDLFDVVRFGIEVGPGIGADLQVTEALQATAMARASAGLGLETLRHRPGKWGAEVAAGVGPVDAQALAGKDWYRTPGDIRFEVHPLLAGAHVALQPVELLDFLGGFLLMDPKDDDF